MYSSGYCRRGALFKYAHSTYRAANHRGNAPTPYLNTHHVDGNRYGETSAQRWKVTVWGIITPPTD